jgi:HEAT repeat protein
MLFQDKKMKLRQTYLKLFLSMLLFAPGTPGTLAMQGLEGPGALVQDSTEISKADSIQRESPLVLSYGDKLQLRFDKSPLLVTILYIVILYSIVTLITLLIIILLNRSRMQRDQSQIDYLLEEYQKLLVDYIFDEEKRKETLEDLRLVANNHMNREVLIDQMIDLSINLKGEIKEIIKDLYFRLGLERDSLEKAHSKKWHKNVKGFRELAFMNIRDANEKIIESLNSNNQILRMEAQIAMVRLSDGNPYEFLHLLEKPLSVWEQITLHELLIQHNLKVPAFKQWFNSENITVVIFALQMVSWFNQKNVGKEMITIFDHENERVRCIAYEVCGDIGLKMAFPGMIKHYPGEPLINRLEILRSFAKVPDEKYLKFLKSVLDMEEDVQLQIQATKAMENTGEPGISMLIKLMKSKSEYKNYQIIIRHVLDGRIY